MRDRPEWRYDFDFAPDVATLKDMIDFINRNGYILVGVTQDKKDVYTVFFRRPADG